MIQIPFEQYQLANGLRVILSPEPRTPVVAVNLWYKVGSRNERPGRTGFAHLFEHMMFQGSSHVPDTAHFAYIEKAGGSLNGSTWLDRTNYYETVPAHYLELALWLESDRMAYLLPAMTQEKLDNQRDVVKNERRWRVDNQPYGDWDERLQMMMYPPEHPYHHSVIGSMEDLDAASLQDVETFFRTYYAPNNAVLTICGDYDGAHVKALVEQYFAEIPAGPAIPPIPGALEVAPVLGEEKRVVVEQDISLPRTFLAFRVPPYGDERFYAADVAATILGTGKASLLHRTLVLKNQTAQDVAAYAFPIVVGAAILVVLATAAETVEAERVEADLLSALDALRTVSDDDVTRAVNLIAAKHLTELQRVDQRADAFSMMTTLFDDPARVNTEIDRYRAVNTADVRAFANEFLGADNRGVLTYIPQSAS
ncbi:MAG TPA: pitrilysin family protein [Longimicrobiales bacterium]|nr:pitrilysin family protein [Longimicrobiales bacterium]